MQNLPIYQIKGTIRSLLICSKSSEKLETIAVIPGYNLLKLIDLCSIGNFKLCLILSLQYRTIFRKYCRTDRRFRLVDKSVEWPIYS